MKIEAASRLVATKDPLDLKSVIGVDGEFVKLTKEAGFYNITEPVEMAKKETHTSVWQTQIRTSR